MAKKKKTDSNDIWFHPSNFTPCASSQNFYEWVNKVYYNRQLPNVVVGFYENEKWMRETDETKKEKTFGATLRVKGAKFAHYILLNPYFKEWTDVNRLTILHESCHIKLDGRHAHGKAFERLKRRLIRLGAFEQFL